MFHYNQKPIKNGKIPWVFPIETCTKVSSYSIETYPNRGASKVVLVLGSSSSENFVLFGMEFGKLGVFYPKKCIRY